MVPDVFFCTVCGSRKTSMKAAGKHTDKTGHNVWDWTNLDREED
jgi:hypothetical protein